VVREVLEAARSFSSHHAADEDALQHRWRFVSFPNLATVKKGLPTFSHS
jgi:hypothetical protein